MKRFIQQVIYMSSLIVLSMLLVYSMADGSTDAFYLKFASPKQSSLIIGSSRAAQGIQPKILDSIIPNTSFFNYAFTITHSPYGEAYYNSIKKKLESNVKSGVFILEVNPWSLAERLTPDGKINNWGEYTTIAETQWVNLPLNIEYLLESFSERNISIILNKNRKGQYHTFFVHDDGWLEVTIESDMFSMKERTINKIKTYKDRLDSYNGLSEFKLHYLKMTIELLKQHGKVYLVRMPLIDGMFRVEQDLSADFDYYMEQISYQYSLTYINMVSDSLHYKYTDGQHLTVEDSREFSIDLSNKIYNFMNR